MEKTREGRTKRIASWLAAGGLAAIAAFGASDAMAQADAVEEFYSGRTVKIVVGFSPGGGYDLYARLAADHIGKHIPGEPTVIVENMPGGGGRRAAGYLYTVAPKDGSEMSVIVQSVAFDAALGELPDVDDPSDFNFIGRLTSNVELQFTWHTSETKSLEDAKQNAVIVGATGPTSPSATVPRMLNETIGTKFEVVSGYGGTAEVALAMERGEVEGMMQGVESLRSTRADWIDQGQINGIWQLALRPHPEFPDVPVVGDLGDTDEDRRMLRLIAGTSEIGRSLVAPPGVPEERVQALRDAFQAMLDDSEFQADAEARNAALDPATGEELQALVEETMQTPEPVIERTRAVLGLD
ncbi:MAG TPA: tripartite tricarboxylate transporter substrate-binding protein [Afifellaceae bacterium]|nr:tripartite tricarboxylate transporter substrate-binding protein [Afifellaceae bacterium]